MKYFINFNVVTKFKKTINWFPTIGSFNKLKLYTDFTDVGIVSEDNREYYAINNKRNKQDIRKNIMLFLNINELCSDNKPFKDNLYCNDEFYSYYSAIDWLMFYGLIKFRSKNIINNFPECFINLKEMLNETPKDFILIMKDKANALENAKWNKVLYETLSKINK